jgi:hypothetical protein
MARPREFSNLICSRVFCLAWMLVAACGNKSTPTAPVAGSGATGGSIGSGKPNAGAGAQGSAGNAGALGVGSGGRGGATTSAGSGGAISPVTGGAGGANAGTGPAAAGSGGSGTPAVGGGADSVLQYHKDAKRSGMYTDAAFTRAAAAMLKKDTTFAGTVAGPTYAQPLYFEGGPGGVDLVITATEQNEVTAFSAADASVVWRKTLAPPATGGMACAGNITPLGVTGTPVIDAASRTLYVAAMTAGPKHQAFALSLDDGSPRTGFPVDLSTVKTPALSFVSADQNQRGALLILNDTLYIPYGGFFGDCGAYHGWVIGVPLNASSAPSAFATQAHAGGIWAPGGLASDGTSVFAATGNTMSDSGGVLSSPPTWGHGDAILRLSPDLATIAESATKDFFAVQNWMTLDQGDLDLGGSGPILVNVPGATPSDLVMALGKGGIAYLLDATNLGGMGGMLDMLTVSGGGINGGMIQAATAYTTPTGTFVAFRANQQVMGCGTGSSFVGALKVSAASPPKLSVGWCAGSDMPSGSPFSTTTDGTNESIVWYVAGTKLIGFNGENGMPVFTGGGASDGVGNINKFQTPIVAKGRIFLAAGNAISAYTLH